MRGDVDYRRQWCASVAGIVCVAAVPLGGFAMDGTPGIVLLALSILAVGLGIVYLACRQQKFMNRKIGDALRHSD